MDLADLSKDPLPYPDENFRPGDVHGSGRAPGKLSATCPGNISRDQTRAASAIFFDAEHPEFAVAPADSCGLRLLEIIRSAADWPGGEFFHRRAYQSSFIFSISPTRWRKQASKYCRWRLIRSSAPGCHGSFFCGRFIALLRRARPAPGNSDITRPSNSGNARHRQVAQQREDAAGPYDHRSRPQAGGLKSSRGILPRVLAKLRQEQPHAALAGNLR